MTDRTADRTAPWPRAWRDRPAWPCAVSQHSALAAALSSCGASAALGSAVLAPLSALPETDVVMETNLQTAVQGGIAASGISAVSGAGNANVPEVSGPPTSVNVVSVGTGATGVSVYSAFNPARQALPRDPRARSGLGDDRPRREHGGLVRLLVRPDDLDRVHGQLACDRGDRAQGVGHGRSLLDGMAPALSTASGAGASRCGPASSAPRLGRQGAPGRSEHVAPAPNQASTPLERP